MPFTVDAVNKTITFEFIAGDPKGNSLANAVTADDYQAAMVAAGEGASWTKQGKQHLIDGWSITITGSATYVHFYNSCIEWTATVLTQAYYIKANQYAHFQIGSDTAGTGVNLYKGCYIMENQPGAKQFYFEGYVKIYDSIFNSSTRSYVCGYKGHSDDPIVVKRTNFINANHITTYMAGYTLANLIFEDVMFRNSSYGINYGASAGGADFYSITGLNVIGMISDIYNTNRTFRGVNWNCPNGGIQLRVYKIATSPNFHLIDGIVSEPFLRATYGAHELGARGEFHWKSTFSFYIENGSDATLKMYDKDNNILIDDVLDASGELEGEEVTYKMKYAECISESPLQEKVETLTYTPFKVEITRTGYAVLTIEGIEIVDGEPTNIFGTLIYPELLISAVTITDCTQIGTDDGQLVITAEGGDGSYTYSINGTDYQASNTFSGLSAGDYTVYVKDGEDTVADFEVTISQPIPEAYADDVLTCDLTEESLDCDLAEEILTCDFIE